MKKFPLFVGGAILAGISILGFKIYSNLKDLGEGFGIEHNLKHPNLILLKSQISPNRKFQFFEYQFDNGGFGFSRVFWSVTKNDSTLYNLEKGVLPDGYKATGWTSENELVIQKWKPYYFKDKEIELRDKDLLNGIKLKLKKQ